MRYKEYNKNKVLEHCIALFWEKGFRGCSVNDIVEKTGVNRFSLYHEFQNKEGILYDSLRLYRERYSSKNFEILKEKVDLKETLKKFYLSFLDEEESFQGCYFIHIGTEMADEDQKIKLLIKDYLSTLENLFMSLLKSHQIAKEEADLYARHLVGLFCTSMSFCLIHSESQRQNHITNGIQVILNKKKFHATNT